MSCLYCLPLLLVTWTATTVFMRSFVYFHLTNVTNQATRLRCQIHGASATSFPSLAPRKAASLIPSAPPTADEPPNLSLQNHLLSPNPEENHSRRSSSSLNRTSLPEKPIGLTRSNPHLSTGIKCGKKWRYISCPSPYSQRLGVNRNWTFLLHSMQMIHR